MNYLLISWYTRNKNIKNEKNAIKNVVEYSSVTPANLYFTVPLQVAVRFRDATYSNISVHSINYCQRSSFWSGVRGSEGWCVLFKSNLNGVTSFKLCACRFNNDVYAKFDNMCNLLSILRLSVSYNRCHSSMKIICICQRILSTNVYINPNDLVINCEWE